MPQGRYLLLEGLVDEDTLEIASEIHTSEGFSLGKSILEMEAMPEQELRSAIRLGMEQSVRDLLGWSEGNFRFVQGERPPRPMVAVELEVDSVLPAARGVS